MTRIEESEMPRRCSSFDATKNCGGGVMVLDGRTGSILWKYWTRKDVLFIDCSENVNADKTKDCLISGKGGVLVIVDGKTGILIWEFSKSNEQYLLDLYSAQYIVDQTGDGFFDVLISHTTDQSSYIIILNGKNGEVIGRIGMPDGGSVFTVPRLLHIYNNTYVIFATGSIETSGSLFLIPLESISHSDLSKSKTIWKGSSSVSSGILIADMNGDDVEDVIFTNGDCLSVLDGKDFTSIWNLTLKESGNSQILIGPTPAYFNNDAYPDLLITNMVGSTFPEYYFSESRIASGDSGKFLLDEPILGNGEITSPAISISFSGVGNDMFLFWSSTCSTSKSNQKQKFTFAKGTTLYDKTHSDLCKLRFNSSQDVQLYLLNQHIEPPGVLLYSSRNVWDNNTENMGTTKPFVVNYSHESDTNVNSLHKNRHKSHFSSQSDEKKNAFSFGKYMDGGNGDKSQWNLPYDDNMPVLPSVNLGELAMRYEASYQDGTSHDEGRDEKMSYGKEMKRFANYQNGFLPRARSTATLVDAINATGIDIIFTIYWEMPVKDVRILTQKEQACIHKKLVMEQTASKLNSLELDVAEERAERACITVRREEEVEVEGERIEEEDSIKGSDGVLTIHRLRLSCSCSRLSSTEQCSEPLPVAAQGYPARASHSYFFGKHTHSTLQHRFLSR
ncbi:uncharacterized protein [Halyomorpha halys]|uniref:uncharacterized protein isoform X2 n=1 Tax=Halyomorpha halys TaxID=286706 RepID=UPI0006D51640|nr:uncharacterized protein LOC106684586 isoform X2 [Halyomorpha halys]XP_014282238.1 uncharacterized protein LOC106684586 isoform X2 [Halyomorpha halys]XP_024215717.1 uncharacterized protein LOC106684586 isoform X2 [Halyomorpha halys]